jgi:hypothetical protein
MHEENRVHSSRAVQWIRAVQWMQGSAVDLNKMNGFSYNNEPLEKTNQNHIPLNS